MKAIIDVTVTRRDGTTTTKRQVIDDTYASRKLTRAELQERMLKAAAGAVKACLK